LFYPVSVPLLFALMSAFVSPGSYWLAGVLPAPGWQALEQKQVAVENHCDFTSPGL
jgi:hypothetical protein